MLDDEPFSIFLLLWTEPRLLKTSERMIFTVYLFGDLQSSNALGIHRMSESLNFV